jgi:hypothetical protein
VKRGVLFCRLDPRFADLASCIEAVRFDLDRLVDTARRVRPEQENLFCAVTFDRAAWEGVQSAIDQWDFDLAVTRDGAPSRYRALRAEIEALRQRAEAVRKVEAAQAVRWIKRAIADYGLSARDLGL